jgi:hypothetical protein
VLDKFPALAANVPNRIVAKGGALSQTPREGVPAVRAETSRLPVTARCARGDSGSAETVPFDGDLGSYGILGVAVMSYDNGAFD